MNEITKQNFIDTARTGDLVLTRKYRWYKWFTTPIYGDTIDRVFVLLRTNSGELLYIDVNDEPSKNIYTISSLIEKYNNGIYTELVYKQLGVLRTTQFTKDMNKSINDCISTKLVSEETLKEKILKITGFEETLPNNDSLSAIVVAYILKTIGLIKNVDYTTIHPGEFFDDIYMSFETNTTLNTYESSKKVVF